MFKIICSVVIILLVSFSAGFKWVPFNSGDPIPLNVIFYSENVPKYVGRARHYDEILPAEVNDTCAIIQSCGKDIVKYQYEILVSQDNSCSWQLVTSFQDIPKNIVRGGTAANGEPIFIGREQVHEYVPYDRYIQRIKPIVSSKKRTYATISRDSYVLICDDNNNWVDTSSSNIPSNAISGGQSKDGHDIFVARLKLSCSIIPGQVTPKLGIASAMYNDKETQSAYCQVLVGDKKEYPWVLSKDGDIPDYAVVGSQDRNGDLMYVARVNKTVGYITHPTLAEINTTYSILVKNVNITFG